MKKAILLTTTLALTSSAQAGCFVLIVGGSYHPSPTKPLDLTIKSKSEEIMADARARGCTVLEPKYNVSAQEYHNQLRSLLQNFKANDKLHISLTDHGNASGIPTGTSEVLKLDDLLETAKSTLARKGISGPLVTYSSHICWGGVLHDQASSFLARNPSFKVCGATSVNAFELSMEKSGRNESARRNNEYISAGWTSWRDGRNSIADFHQAGASSDVVNFSRGSETTSMHFLKKSLGYHPYGDKQFPNPLAEFLANPLKGGGLDRLLPALDTDIDPGLEGLDCNISDATESLEIIKLLKNALQDQRIPASHFKGLLEAKGIFARRYASIMVAKQPTGEDQNNGEALSISYDFNRENLKTILSTLDDSLKELKAAFSQNDVSRKAAFAKWDATVKKFIADNGNSPHPDAFPWSSFSGVSDAFLRKNPIIKQLADDNFSSDSGVDTFKGDLQERMNQDWRDLQTKIEANKVPIFLASSRLQQEVIARMEEEIKRQPQHNQEYQRLKACEQLSAL